MDREDRNLGMITIFSFLVGGAVGAGLALLLAPQTGKKTRRQIREMAEDLSEQASGYAGMVKKKVF
ncbi:MAG TPA: YtxH domain-containing protein [Dissulfurispiraceae bacterium]|nr:YtxH domain-containing protein [Dissulfurispiraceae bacterium]